MRSAILYGSLTKLTNAHKPVFSPTSPPNMGMRQPEYYVRMDCLWTDVEDALDKARPMEGETVLNTVEIPDLTYGKEQAE